MTIDGQIPCTVCKTPFKPLRRHGIAISKTCKECAKLVKEAKRNLRETRRRIKEERAKITPQMRRKETFMQMSQPKLLSLAQTHFNEFIRNRDRLPMDRFYCPTCRQFKFIEGGNFHACHCYPAGKYSALRFHEQNVWGGCSQCNRFQHGTSYRYNDWVREKIGEEDYARLEEIQKEWDLRGDRWDKFDLIEIIEKYTELNKQYHER